MPPHGVFVEEAAPGRRIEGVPTAIAGFVGTAPEGPVGVAMPVASAAEYVAAFGGMEAGHLGLALQLFFANGGRRAHVVRAAAADAAGFLAALPALGAIEEIAVIAAPGSAALPEADAVRAGLIAAAEARGDRLALLAGPEAAGIAEIRAVRALHDSSRAALYHPWLMVAGADGAPVATGPEGAVAGIIARTDAERGVHQAPANEVVRGILGLAQQVGRAEQEVLNPEGINLLRDFPGRGIRVYGARTMSGDPEWRLLPTRRLLMFLEASIARGTHWAVFEPQGEALWAALRRCVEDFLYGLWRDGVLLGQRPADAFFVRCDRSTMTEADIAAGRVICLVGGAPVQPGEFVIFRIAQRTAGAPG
jgi:phage tail sheath protein FI